ncbi:MAG TPA: cytochrome P450 [Deltaproteobacteria bacterium]|nr:cytochrome P450 [Deltaproteobacteria bacterium]
MFWRAPTVPLADQPGGTLAHLHGFRHHPLEMFLRAGRQQEPLVRFRLGPMWVLGVYDPDLIETVLIANPEVFAKATRGQRLLRVLLGDSMLTTEGTIWRERRRLGQPHFKRAALERYRPVMRSAARAMAERLAAADGTVVGVADEMMALTLRIATEALFGGALGEASTEVHEALAEVLDAYMWMITMPVPSPERWPVGATRRFRRSQRKLFQVVDQVIARRRADPSPGDDLLGDWLAAGLTDEDLRSEVVTMLLAAHETTANLLSWTLGLLSRHPDARRRLERELDGRDRDSPVQLADLPCLQGVLLESLRILPPVWMLSRSTTTGIELGGHQLQPNTFVFICTHAIHRDPRLWPNPEGFDPARWAGGARPLHRAAFLPFGAGQRRCIGEQFAMIEAAEILAALLPAVRLDLVPGTSLTPKASVTLRPEGPLPMQIHTRRSSVG